MGRLAQNTLNAYKTKLRKYRKLLPLLPEDHPERPRLIATIEKLTNKLGLEMTELEIQLARGPGRPREEPLVDEELEALGRIEQGTPVEAETSEDRERRVQKRHQELKEKLQREDPEFLARKEAERKSQEELERMTKHGGDDEGRK